MPAKKKAKKAAGKKKVAKTKTKKTAKKAVKKKAVRKAVKKKAVKRKAEKKSAAGRTAGKAAQKPVAKEKPEIVTPVEPPPPPKPKKKLGIDCEHCAATGVCAAGPPYDKSHGQMFGAKVRMTSCIDCLLAAGEHKNSKKLVACRVCDGDGKV